MVKIVFFGTPDYILPIVKSLHKAFKSKEGSPVIAVVTQKPKPAGRKKLLTYSPVDTWAYKKSLPKYFDPEDIVKNKIKADIGILASYGKLIPKNVISHFPYGILNIHPSLLPKFRGASPVQAAIIAGDKETGVTIIKMDEKLDHGPIVSQFREDILKDDTAGSLRIKLFEKSVVVLSTLIPAYIKGKIKPRVQDENDVVYTRQIKKEDAFIPQKLITNALQRQSLSQRLSLNNIWKIPFIKDCSLFPDAYSLDRFIRAMSPWPTAWTYVRLTKNSKLKTQNLKRLKILSAHVEKLTPNASCLVPDLVQLEGKSEVTWQQFKTGYPKAIFAQAP